MMPKPLERKPLALCITTALLMSNFYCASTHAETFLANTTLYYYGSGNSNGNRSDFTNYDEVNITTTDRGTTSGGLKGWAIYMNGENYKFNDLTVKTTGMMADGIHTKNGGGNIVIENYNAITSGYSSDGINLGRELNANYSRVTVNNETNIKATGMGVRANASINNANAVATITLNGPTTIETTSAGSTVAGYAVYAGQDTEANSTAVKGKAEIFLNGDSTLKTVGKSAHAVYARAAGTVSLGNVNISAMGDLANGLFASSSSAGQQAAIYLAKDAVINVGTGSAVYASGAEALVKSYDIDSGTEVAGVYLINGNIVADNDGQVSLHMADGSVFTGITNSNQLATSAANAGDIALQIDGSNSLWKMTGDSVLSSLTLNNGTVEWAGASAGNVLTVAGNYQGNNGLLRINTVLGDDNSVTDKLVVEGDTSGTTFVAVTNAGGSGDKTINGIEVIHVDGASDGNFVQSGRIVAGSYEYALRRGEGTTFNHWYLMNAATTPEEPVPEQPVPEQPTLRPESGSYIANLAAANTMFTTRLHDRLGETQYIDRLTGEQKVTSMWMRNVGGHTRFKDSSGQLSTQSNRYVLQLGGDIAQWSTNGLDRWHLGLMAGYGNSQSNTKSDVSRYHSRGQVTGYSAGIYGTWYANEADKTGSYLDSWILYNWFNNKVYGERLASEKYDSDGITASVEGGYSFLMGERRDGRSTYWLQPKAQLTWMGVQADNHTEANGTRVKGKGDGNLQTRLGLKAFIKGYSAIDEGKEREFQPFVETNWIYNTRSYGVVMNGVTNYQAGTRNIGELKAGVEGQLGKNLHLWGNVAQQIGDKGYSDTQGMLGIKYAF
ncbi:autotransporter outer membrane beta-barrel domain-containing protein [Kluyvera ascorbata]|uniref:autotransporter outer membrane beta-barrel domain-containing protein n=1 Tax=Kluyvera ascorbata TaxID=51288 RepID=UPI0028DF17B1|nr:autotransporter outer membrane beta-barrel domain-containing protein [Kluyvera ascorbata]MDT8702910.1 autotransporter outer membrane beta-barrel domain-containing protein [Kluyvera ascorbata]